MKSLNISVATALCCNAFAGDVIQLGDVTVTATKSSIETFEAPASVTVVDAEDIEKRSIQRADQALKDVPGAYVRGKGDNMPSNFSNSVTLRGIPGYYRTAVLVDDIALNDSFSGAVNWSSIPVDEIERIEVVSGPFSSLYGGNAMGGVINVITKKPTKQELSAKFGYGSNNQRSGSFSYRDKLFERLGVSVHYDRMESDGYVSDQVVKPFSPGTGTVPVTGWKKTTDPYGNPAYLLGNMGKRSWWEHNAGLKLDYDVDDRSSLSMGFSYHNYETDYEHFNTYLRDASGMPVYSGNVQIDDGIALHRNISEKDFLFGPNGQEITKYTLGYEREFDGDIVAKLNAAYTEYGYWYISQSSGATAGGGPGSITEIPSNKTFGSLQVNFPIGVKQYFVTGVDVNKNELTKKTTTLGNWRDDDSKTDLTYRSEGQSTTQAVYLQDEIAFDDAWTLYLGGRYDYWETNGVVNGYGTSPYHLAYSSKNFSQFSPKASLVYLPTGNTTLRTSVGRAFRAPTLSDLYSSWVSSVGKLSQANPNLKPEKTTSWEFGIEQKFKTKTSVKATYYENYLTDLIYTSDVNASLSEKRNAGKAEIKGVEVGINQWVTDGVSAFMNFTYNDARIVKNSSVPASEGKRVTYVPQKQLNAGLEFDKGDWSGSVTGTYVGAVTTKDDNSDDVKGVYGGFDAYTTVDAKIAYRIQKWAQVSLAVNNVFDSKYYQYYLMPGRTFYGELSFKY